MHDALKQITLAWLRVGYEALTLAAYVATPTERKETDNDGSEIRTM